MILRLRARPTRGCPAVLFLLFLSVILAVSVSALAQQSRTEEITKKQSEKTAQLKPKTGNKAEAILARVQNSGLMGATPNGFYPWVGSVLGGGSAAFGGGYRATYADTGKFNLLGGWSVRNYRSIESGLKLPDFADRRVTLSFDAKWLYADKVSFYGLGNNTSKDTKTSYLYEPVRFGTTLTVKPIKWFSLGGGYDYLDVNTGPGKSGIPVDEGFTPSTAPGLGQDVNYNVGRLFAAIDWRQSPGYTRKGGLYRCEWDTFSESQHRPYSFKQTQIELVQHVPFLRENWVLAFRGLATLTDGKGGDQVPFYMMPYLGSGRTLRGFANRRYRDLNRLLVTAEYRWTPGHFVDMAFFFDAGKVADRRSDLDLNGLHTDYGIGIRFHAPGVTAIRFDVARSREGWGFIFSGGPVF